MGVSALNHAGPQEDRLRLFSRWTLLQDCACTAAVLATPGYQHVRLLTHPIEFSSGTASWADQYHNVEVISSQVKILFLNLGLINANDFDQLQQRALSDMLRDDFAAVGQMTTVVGTKPALTHDEA